MNTFVDSICVRQINSAGSLLYGLGNNLCLLENSKKTFCKLKSRDKIHELDFKIVENAVKIICCAGRELLITDLVEGNFENSFLVKINEWILAVKIYEDLSCVLITGHNYAVYFKLIDKGIKILQQSVCDDNSTLYCAHINGKSFESSLFYTGTALGELLIWTPKEGSKILYRINAHNGVIFSIATDLKNSLLVTASDDRSIKIWNIEDKNEEFNLVASKQSFGHLARVFVTKIIRYDNKILIVSAGEDSNICIWDVNGNLLVKKNLYYSAIIWDFDYNEYNKTLVTCSSNGKLNKFHLDTIFKSNFIENLFEFEKPEVPGKVKCLENSILVVITAKSQLYFKENEENWRKFEGFENNSFTLLEVLENRIFLAEKNFIFVLDYKGKFDIKLRICIDDFLGIPENLGFYFIRTVHVLSLDVILVCNNSGKCLLLDLKDLRVKGLFSLPKCSEPWTTSARIHEDNILIADRNGSLHLFKVPQKCQENFEDSLETIKKVHGNLGITNLLEDGEFLKTTGNDGTVKSLQISKNSIEIISVEKTLVNYIERVLEIDNKLFLLGFNDDYLVIYEKSNGIVYEARVGGRHRNWDFRFDHKTNKIQIFYIQNKSLKSIDFILEGNQVDDHNWHIKECNKVVLEELGNEEHLLVSGGEDNTLKFKLLKNQEVVSLDNVKDVFTHISSIKTICTSWIDGELWIFSAGGRAQIVGTRYMENKVLKDEISYLLSGDKYGKFYKNITTFDPETRFTCMIVVDGLIYVGCSDGFLRTFQLKTDTKDISFEKEIFYGKCFLQIYRLEDFLVTMATDGFICFWKLNKTDLELVDKIKHNQSGINSFDFFRTKNHWIVATGGDDQSIFVSTFKIENSIDVLSTRHINIHTAQVTGLKFLNEKFLLSTSIDQTVCKLNLKGNEIKLVDEKFSCVSDVKGFIIFGDSQNILMYGSGMEILNGFDGISEK